jgi:hypothetical protein
LWNLQSTTCICRCHSCHICHNRSRGYIPVVPIEAVSTWEYFHQYPTTLSSTLFISVDIIHDRRVIVTATGISQLLLSKPYRCGNIHINVRDPIIDSIYIRGYNSWSMYHNYSRGYLSFVIIKVVLTSEYSN